MISDLDSAVGCPVHNVPEDGWEDLGEVPVHQHPAAQPWPWELCRGGMAASEWWEEVTEWELCAVKGIAQHEQTQFVKSMQY